ncbi:MAG: hypothetical protein HC764_20505 [Pleurocapsa sp. CRU_1_2]|nr:hypothetical protein [Pleurocapsa sp. CRU_1_2]
MFKQDERKKPEKEKKTKIGSTNRSIDGWFYGEQISSKKAINWIEQSNFSQIASFNREHSSYMLKHLVEAQIGQYVSNESLIVAMVNCGFKGKPIVMGSSVYCFNVSQKSVNKASEGISIF